MDFCHQKNQDHPSSVLSTSLHCPLHNHDAFQKMNNVSISMTDYSGKFACQHNNCDMMITFPTVRFKAIEAHIDQKYGSCQNQLIHSGNVLVIRKSQGSWDNSGKDLTGSVRIQSTLGSIRRHDCRISLSDDLQNQMLGSHTKGGSKSELQFKLLSMNLNTTEKILIVNFKICHHITSWSFALGSWNIMCGPTHLPWKFPRQTASSQTGLLILQLEKLRQSSWSYEHFNWKTDHLYFKTKNVYFSPLHYPSPSPQCNVQLDH